MICSDCVSESQEHDGFDEFDGSLGFDESLE